eukprot:TRINITY_DN4715_c0_g1_i2.p1 TRINITY_DN4715_c0_g1~~TRINITY_DN4715_c0_g1_i2.p1  ORF type:complete len:1762 (+),score=339.09 TRINITY_DN4715_c0_g1_i2:247-5286(+)
MPSQMQNPSDQDYTTSLLLIDSSRPLEPDTWSVSHLQSMNTPLDYSVTHDGSTLYVLGRAGDAKVKLATFYYDPVTLKLNFWKEVDMLFALPPSLPNGEPVYPSGCTGRLIPANDDDVRVRALLIWEGRSPSSSFAVPGLPYIFMATTWVEGGDNDIKVDDIMQGSYPTSHVACGVFNPHDGHYYAIAVMDGVGSVRLAYRVWLRFDVIVDETSHTTHLANITISPLLDNTIRLPDHYDCTLYAVGPDLVVGFSYMLLTGGPKLTQYALIHVDHVTSPNLTTSDGGPFVVTSYDYPSRVEGQSSTAPGAETLARPFIAKDNRTTYFRVGNYTRSEKIQIIQHVDVVSEQVLGAWSFPTAGCHLYSLDTDSTSTKMFAMAQCNEDKPNGVPAVGVFTWNMTDMMMTSLFAEDSLQFSPAFHEDITPRYVAPTWHALHPHYGDIVIYVLAACEQVDSATCYAHIIVYNTSSCAFYHPIDSYHSPIKVEPPSPTYPISLYRFGHRVISFDGEYLLLQSHTGLNGKGHRQVTSYIIQISYSTINDTWGASIYNVSTSMHSFSAGIGSSPSSAMGSSPLCIGGDCRTSPLSLGFPGSIPYRPVYDDHWDETVSIVDVPGLTVMQSLRSRDLRFNQELAVDINVFNASDALVTFQQRSLSRLVLPEMGKGWALRPSSYALTKSNVISSFASPSGSLICYLSVDSATQSSILSLVHLDTMTPLLSTQLDSWVCAYALIDGADTFVYVLCRTDPRPSFYLLRLSITTLLSYHITVLPFDFNTNTSVLTSSISTEFRGMQMEPGVIPRFIYIFFTDRYADTPCRMIVFNVRDMIEYANQPLIGFWANPISAKWDQNKHQIIIGTIPLPTFDPSRVGPVALPPTITTYNVDCPPGTYRSPETHTCIPASPGYHVPSDGYINQLPCPSRQYSNLTGSVDCEICPPGTYGTQPAQVQCTACDPGHYSFGNECLACSPGTYSALDRSSCVICPRGTFCNTTACSECAPCGPGLVALQFGMTSCVPCPSGTIPSEGGSSCRPCPEGHVPTADMTSCTKCPAGTVAEADQCVLCSPGTFSASPASVRCFNCPEGTSAPNYGSQNCTPCIPGYFSQNLDVPHPTCSPCPAGTHAPHPGTSSCTVCPPGTKANTEGAPSCLQCEAGTYGNSSALVSCTHCRDKSSPNENSTVCECVPGYFSYESGGTCMTCPNGGICEGGTSLAARPGFWRASPGHSSFEACPSPSCQGGHLSQCAVGYSGPLCAVCQAGYGSHDKSCVRCDQGLSVVSWVVFVVAFLLFMLLLLQPPGNNHGIFSKVKILVSFLQVVSEYNNSMGTAWPPEFVKFINLASLVNLNIMRMTSLDCALGYHIDLYTAYIFQILVPVVLGAFMTFLLGICYLTVTYIPCLAATRLFSRYRHQSITTMWIRNAMFILVLSYPSVCTQILSIFRCHTIGDQTYSMVDYTVECYSSLWYSFEYGSFVLLGVWIVGVPVLFFIVLRRFHSRLDDTMVLQRFGFIYFMYKRGFFFWELLELVRRLFFTSLVLFVGRGSPTQFIVALLVSGMTVWCQTFFWPYVERSDNWIQLTSLLGIFFTLYYGTFRQSDQTGHDPNQPIYTALLLAVNVLSIALVVVYLLLILLQKSKPLVGMAKTRWKGRRRSRGVRGHSWLRSDSSQFMSSLRERSVELMSTGLPNHIY